ncbi:hypothetical protein F2Q70_00017463 [Brassica cretica]|uniref:Uncharacterized protein n=1 Tax=Brassica cretica TaxID=69181 RepID=A0A8S9HTZ9_BRACR|nr:hypothetical protein F2Q70_00017463 [Brassica cretica]
MIIPLHRSILALICRPRPLPREREEDPIPLFAHSDNPRTAVSIEPTRFVDPDVNRQLGIREDLENMFVELADTPAVERNTEPAVGTSSPGPEQPAEAVRPIPEVVPPREYIPKVPYPVPAKATQDPLELALVRAEAEQSVVNIDAAGYAKMLDSARKDPLELALVRAEAEQSVVNIDAVGYAKMLDSARSMGRMRKQKESEQPTADTPTAEKEREPTVGTNSPRPEQPAEAVRPIPDLFLLANALLKSLTLFQQRLLVRTERR